MSKSKVLIGSRPGPEVEAMLQDAPSEVEIHFLPEGEKLGDHVADVDIIYGTIREDDFPKAKSLQWMQQPFVGVEWARYPAFRDSDVRLVNSRVLYGPQIAEHAFALLLSMTRGILTQRDFMKDKHWKWTSCVEVAGMTMGLLGLGGIGRAIATRAKAFELNVIAVDKEPVEKPDTVDELGQMDWLPEFLSKSDILMVCCPITPETHKLLSHEQFNLMPDGSYLVNVSRGKVVDEDALIAALDSGKLAGAGLDVTYTEPCPPESPLWTKPNVILASHTAGASQHIAKRAMALFIENLHHHVKGEPLVNVVDKQKGY
ncbi:MAG: D-2-hydroxyacid dehydrogenase [Candidatus Poribacteria bacterium]|nr:D-2-hydroxyacid dehydrogenase [Candidatus Poribacteria bacterium]